MLAASAGEPMDVQARVARISVELVMDLLAGGYTPDQIRQQYDHLTLDDIHACLAYAGEVNRTEQMFAVNWA